MSILSISDSSSLVSTNALPVWCDIINPFSLKQEIPRVMEYIFMPTAMVISSGIHFNWNRKVMGMAAILSLLILNLENHYFDANCKAETIS